MFLLGLTTQTSCVCTTSCKCRKWFSWGGCRCRIELLKSSRHLIILIETESDPSLMTLPTTGPPRAMEVTPAAFATWLPVRTNVPGRRLALNQKSYCPIKMGLHVIPWQGGSHRCSPRQCHLVVKGSSVNEWMLLQKQTDTSGEQQIVGGVKQLNCSKKREAKRKNTWSLINIWQKGPTGLQLSFWGHFTIW